MVVAEDAPNLTERRSAMHYHGDVVRVLFVASALLMLGAETLGGEMPLSTVGIVAFAIVLVVAAGITNPAQAWIHYLNFIIAVCGAGVFGLFAIERYQVSHTFVEVTYLSAEALALIFLFAVYYTTKTVRGILLRPHLT